MMHIVQLESLIEHLFAVGPAWFKRSGQASSAPGDSEGRNEIVEPALQAGAGRRGNHSGGKWRDIVPQIESRRSHQCGAKGSFTPTP